MEISPQMSLPFFYGYMASDCYGDGDSDSDGYGNGYGDGDNGDGYGDSDSDGYGNGYGNNGYGNNGYGNGDNGYGYGYGYNGYAYWHATLAHIHTPGAITAYWCANADGTPANGGNATTRAYPGLIQEIPGPLKMCTARALHATLAPGKWKGESIWIVQMYPPYIIDDDKIASLKRKFISEVAFTKNVTYGGR